MSYPDLEILNSHVSKVFRIDDVTAGDPREWIVRYRGQLMDDDSVAAYDLEIVLPGYVYHRLGLETTRRILVELSRQALHVILRPTDIAEPISQGLPALYEASTSLQR